MSTTSENVSYHTINAEEQVRFLECLICKTGNLGKEQHATDDSERTVGDETSM
jgi:hypothetical protein